MNKRLVAVIDYEMGNVGSILNMLRKIGVATTLTRDKNKLESADKLILPGVGSFDVGMRSLYSFGLIDALNELVLVEGKPTLGICLGMQLMTRRSEEGAAPGLGWIDAETIRLIPDPQHNRRVPNMGWSEVHPVKRFPLFANAANDCRFYFVHSYHAVCKNTEDIAASACFGRDFVAAFSAENIHGVQFHPEKSHRHGIRLLTDFVNCA